MSNMIDEATMAELVRSATRAAEQYGWDHFKFPPGPMEGNPWWVPYLYGEICLDGDGETCGVWECSELTPEEREAFKLSSSDVIGLRVDDNGFVHYKLMEMKEYEELQAEAQFDREHE